MKLLHTSITRVNVRTVKAELIESLARYDVRKFISPIALLFVMNLSYGQVPAVQTFEQLRPSLIYSLECRDRRQVDVTKGFEIAALPISRLHLEQIREIKHQKSDFGESYEFPIPVQVYGLDISRVSLTRTIDQSEADDNVNQALKFNGISANDLSIKIATELGVRFNKVDGGFRFRSEDGQEIAVFEDEPEGDVKTATLFCGMVIPPFCSAARSRTVTQPWPVAALG
ncbi:MAG: hypothetical protein U1E84_01290 [Rhodoferax sp.]